MFAICTYVIFYLLVFMVLKVEVFVAYMCEYQKYTISRQNEC